MATNGDKGWCWLAVVLSAAFCLLMLAAAVSAEIVTRPVPVR